MYGKLHSFLQIKPERLLLRRSLNLLDHPERVGETARHLRKLHGGRRRHFANAVPADTVDDGAALVRLRAPGAGPQVSARTARFGPDVGKRFENRSKKDAASGCRRRRSRRGRVQSALVAGQHCEHAGVGLGLHRGRVSVVVAGAQRLH